MGITIAAIADSARHRRQRKIKILPLIKRINGDQKPRHERLLLRILFWNICLDIFLIRALYIVD